MRSGALAALLSLSLSLVPALAQDEDLPPAVATRVQDLCRRVETLRGLAFKEKVVLGVMGKEELAKFIAGEIDREMPAEDMEAARLSLVAFGILPDGYDLRDLLIRLFSEQIAGFYDPRTDRLYLIAEGTDLETALSSNEEVWIHELTHALDDQHFDLEAMSEKVKEEDDASLAQSVLTEGVATYVMFHGQLQAAGGDFDLPLELLTATLRFSEWAAAEQETESDAAVRRFKEFYMGIMIAPYREGLRFSRALVNSAGGSSFEKVDAAYRNPPRSTEQVLHPEKYLAGEEPEAIALPDVAAELGEGWRLVETNHMGELQTRVLLRQKLGSSALAEGLYSGLSRFFGSREDALGQLYDDVFRASSPVEMAAGWSGDTYRVYAREGSSPALVWRTRWDGARDAGEFSSGVRSAYPGLTRVVESGRTVDVLLGVPGSALEAIEETLAGGR